MLCVNGLIEIQLYLCAFFLYLIELYSLFMEGRVLYSRILCSSVSTGDLLQRLPSFASLLSPYRQMLRLYFKSWHYCYQCISTCPAFLFLFASKAMLAAPDKMANVNNTNLPSFASGSCFIPF
jgi:hypothetical protein